MVTNPLFDLTGQTALVTGSTRGLGRAMAEGLAKAGARIIVNGTDRGRVEEAVAAFRHAGFSALGEAFDVADELAVEQAFARLDQAGVEVGIVVNNAGIQLRGPMVELTAAEWRRVVDTNLTGAFIVAREAARRMIPRKAGKVINIASVTSECARATIAPYAAAKGGIRMLTRTMAAEWAPHGIQANAIGPGYMETDMNQALMANPEFDAWVRRRTPSGRWGLPEELAGTVVYLSSAASNYVNGQVIYVDGGLLAIL